MSGIHIERVHTLGKADARKSAEHIAARLKHELKIDSQWHGDVLQLTHAGAKGSIVVADNKVEVRVELPFLLRPLRAKVEREIEQQLDKYLT
ncbi:MAG TPA: polyhydroxyalkanoic acid system family protein [Methylophilaceae bacterium]|jgi:putative polyhydroxyalkanoate system protein